VPSVHPVPSDPKSDQRVVASLPFQAPTKSDTHHNKLTWPMQTSHMTKLSPT
jgi:hypothetical protein